MEHEPIEECPAWLRFVGHAEVRGHEARGYGRVGDLTRAVDLLEAAVNDQARTTPAKAWPEPCTTSY